MVKSRDTDSTSNYREITLFPVMLKVFTFIIAQRMKDWAEIEGKLHDYQLNCVQYIVQLMLYL